MDQCYSFKQTSTGRRPNKTTATGKYIEIVSRRRSRHILQWYHGRRVGRRDKGVQRDNHETGFAIVQVSAVGFLLFSILAIQETLEDAKLATIKTDYGTITYIFIS